MSPWSDRRALELLHTTLPIVQAPMAGAQGVELAIAVSRRHAPRKARQNQPGISGGNQRLGPLLAG